LQVAEPLGVRFDYPLRFSLLEADRIGRIEFGELEAGRSTRKRLKSFDCFIMCS
jgi:hypothetical protein